MLYHSKIAHHGLIGILILGLFAITLVLMHPTKRLSVERDVLRKEHVRLLIQSLEEYKSLHENVLTEVIDADTSTVQQIGTAKSGCAITCGGYATEDICVDLLILEDETFLAKLPVDPKTGTEEKTGYFVNLTSNGGLIVGACLAEGENVFVKQ